MRPRFRERERPCSVNEAESDERHWQSPFLSLYLCKLLNRHTNAYVNKSLKNQTKKSKTTVNPGTSYHQASVCVLGLGWGLGGVEWEAAEVALLLGSQSPWPTLDMIPVGLACSSCPSFRLHHTFNLI